jgi:DMSO/TMAO reductase YedYZ heme-binding membrane subunit
MVAAAMLVASLVWGVLLSTRALRPVDRPAWLLAMHRWLSTLAIVGTALHLGALVADNYVHFGARELLVPMASSWQPGAVAVGVVGFYLLVLIELSSLVTRHLPKRLWHGMHLMSYAMVWLVVVHAGMAGTDASNRVYQAVALLLTVVAVTATVLRVVMGRHVAQRRTADAARERVAVSAGAAHE